MVVVLRCPWYVFLFQLSTISFTLRQLATTGTTHLANWLASSIVFCRKLMKELHCLLWTSGTNMYWPITQSVLLLQMESSCTGREYWRLSTSKFGGSYLKIGTGFQREPRRFLEEFTTFVVSTVASRSKVGQGLSCFCPAIIIGGDNHAPLHLLGLMSDRLLECEWMKGSEFEACRAEYQSFVQEQRQLERSSTRSCPDISDVLSFFSLQAGFCARQHLFKACIVTKDGKACWLV